MTRIFSNLFVVQGSISYSMVNLLLWLCVVLSVQFCVHGHWIGYYLAVYIYLQSHLKVCHPLLLSVSSCFCRWIGLNPPSPLFKLYLFNSPRQWGAPGQELEPNIHNIPPYPLEDDNNWSQATRRYINKYVNFYVMLMVESVSTNHCSVPVVHYTVHWISIDLMLMINDDQPIAISGEERKIQFSIKEKIDQFIDRSSIHDPQYWSSGGWCKIRNWPNYRLFPLYYTSVLFVLFVYLSIWLPKQFNETKLLPRSFTVWQ